MKVNELRIGNWVECKACFITLRLRVDEIVKVNCDYSIRMSPDGIHHIESLVDRLNPIPLTEDILTKLGFDKDEDGYKGCIELSYGNTLLGYPDDNELYLSINSAEYGIGQSIRYLHQLQNIYFDLIGKELKI